MQNNTLLLFAVSLAFLLAVSFSFAFQPALFRGGRFRQNVRGSVTSLFYQLNSTNDRSSETGGTQPPSAYTIPVIGPLLNQPPMLMGATVWLDPPTPLQWKTIEVCVDALTQGEKSALAT
jgi:hypothetical protein